MVRPAHHERLCEANTPLILSLSKDGAGWFDKLTMSGRKQGNPATQATVVPAKAGIQEIPRKRAGRLPRVLDSGFRRNDG